MPAPRKARRCISFANVSKVAHGLAALLLLCWVAALLRGLGRFDSGRLGTPPVEWPAASFDTSVRGQPGLHTPTPSPSLRRPAPPPSSPRPLHSSSPRPPPRSPPQSPAAASPVVCGGHRASSCDRCPQGHGESWCHGDCRWTEGECRDLQQTPIHPAYKSLLEEYPFQSAKTDRGELVNIIFVRTPFRSPHQEELYRKYRDEILFIGLSSFEDYPLPPVNPFSPQFPKDTYVGMFPAFLHMFRDASVFPSHVKTILMSQSDFDLPDPGETMQKEYDFVFSGTDQDVQNDCVGWSSFAKNWSFVLQSLDVMCREYGLSGVLVASKDKEGKKACSIPESCKGKVLQTSFLEQTQFFTYVKQSRFAFLPQVHDASPRAAAQALTLNTPVLMNWHIVGGWKYVNSKTGEFFHDMSDFRTGLERVMHGAKTGSYKPREYMLSNYGNEIAGTKLKEFVLQNFRHRVSLPEDCRLLLPGPFH